MTRIGGSHKNDGNGTCRTQKRKKGGWSFFGRYKLITEHRFRLALINDTENYYTKCDARSPTGNRISEPIIHIHLQRVMNFFWEKHSYFRNGFSFCIKFIFVSVVHFEISILSMSTSSASIAGLFFQINRN